MRRRVTPLPRPLGRGRPPAGTPRAAPLLAVAVLLAALPAALVGQSVVTQDEALRLAFPEATRIERHTAYLRDGELDTARRLAGRGVEMKRGVVTYYLARRGAEALGVAYFDAHRVRTLPEVLMVVVSPRDEVLRVEVLKFSEPPEYRAPDGWLRQFEGERLSDELALKRGIVGITGATLTSDAVTDAVRRTLSLHRVIRPFAAKPTPEAR